MLTVRELKARLNECSDDDALVYCFNIDNEDVQIAKDFDFVSERTDAFGVVILTRNFNYENR